MADIRIPRKTAEQIPAQRSQEPEVQRGLLSANRVLRAVQVLLQLVFPSRRSVAVYTSPEDWLHSHIYRPSGVCTSRHDGEGGIR